MSNEGHQRAREPHDYCRANTKSPAANERLDLPGFTLNLSLSANFASLDERLNAFLERIQNRQLLCEAERAALPSPGRFPSKNV